MNTLSEIALHAVGTSEGVTKAWDTRGRNPKMVPNTVERIATENFLQKQGFKLDQYGPWKMDQPSTYVLRVTPDYTRTDNSTHTVVVYPDGSWEHFAEMSNKGRGVSSLTNVIPNENEMHIPMRPLEHLPQPLHAGKSVKDLMAYGTTEGVLKEWDERGRDKKQAIAPERFKIVSDKLNTRDRRDWSALPSSFEHDAVKAAFQDIKPFIEKTAISQRVKASKATTFEELRSSLGITKNLQAYGTSDGMKKAWDTRGRGKHTMGEREKGKVRAVQTIKLPSGATFYKGKTVNAPMLTPPSKQDLRQNQPGYVVPGTMVKIPAGRLWPEQAYWKNGNPTAERHPMKDEFRRAGGDVDAISRNTFKPMPGAKTSVYQANDIGADRAATVFSSHNAKTDEGRIVEFNHGADNRLQYRKQNQNLLSNMGETQVVRFSSGRAHSTYLRQRYGIDKDFKS